MRILKCMQTFIASSRFIFQCPTPTSTRCFYSLTQSSAPQLLSFRFPDEQPIKFQERGFAKSRDKPKGDKHSKVDLTDEELENVIDIQSYRNELEQEYENLQKEYINNLSIRTSLGALENILVELDGEKYPLNEIAQIIRKSPAMVVINATDFPQASANIKKAIVDSGMNLNPQQDGTTIYVPVPKVTKEFRDGLAHNAKTLCEKSKTRIRETQNKYVKKSKSKDGKISGDILHKAQLKIREIAADQTLKLDTLMKSKQNEIMKK